LKAEKLILVTDVDGILRDDKSLISRVTPQEIDELISKNVIRGGMVPKAKSAVEALKDGVQSVHIISGKKASMLLAEVFTETGSGTMIHRNNGQPVKGRGRKARAKPVNAPPPGLASETSPPGGN